MKVVLLSWIVTALVWFSLQRLWAGWNWYWKWVNGPNPAPQNQTTETSDYVTNATEVVLQWPILTLTISDTLLVKSIAKSLSEGMNSNICISPIYCYIFTNQKLFAGDPFVSWLLSLNSASALELCVLGTFKKQYYLSEQFSLIMEAGKVRWLLWLLKANSNNKAQGAHLPPRQEHAVPFNGFLGFVIDNVDAVLVLLCEALSAVVSSWGFLE